MDQNCDLTQRKCVPCRGGIPPLRGKKLSELLSQLEGWRVVHEHHLEKDYLFPNFKNALSFTLQLGHLAEDEDHHPDIHLSYGRVKVCIWTHKIDGLSESDFILAAKCDALANTKGKN